MRHGLLYIDSVANANIYTHILIKTCDNTNEDSILHSFGNRNIKKSDRAHYPVAQIILYISPEWL
jgi:hypothetical protein